MTTNTDETFIRTSPPLNRFTVKLGGPAPWEVLTADMAREAYWTIRGEWGSGPGELLDYADAVDALTSSIGGRS